MLFFFFCTFVRVFLLFRLLEVKFLFLISGQVTDPGPHFLVPLCVLRQQQLVGSGLSQLWAGPQGSCWVEQLTW